MLTITLICDPTKVVDKDEADALRSACAAVVNGQDAAIAFATAVSVHGGHIEAPGLAWHYSATLTDAIDNEHDTTPDDPPTEPDPEA